MGVRGCRRVVVCLLEGCSAAVRLRWRCWTIERACAAIGDVGDCCCEHWHEIFLHSCSLEVKRCDQTLLFLSTGPAAMLFDIARSVFFAVISLTCQE